MNARARITFSFLGTANQGNNRDVTGLAMLLMFPVGLRVWITQAPCGAN